jgi:hypothetical protein
MCHASNRRLPSCQASRRTAHFHSRREQVHVANVIASNREAEASSLSGTAEMFELKVMRQINCRAKQALANAIGPAPKGARQSPGAFL